jgi:hypothetical protein
LIFSEDPLAAALLGAAVELVGFRPAFPADDDSPRSVLLRVRPGVVLVECDHEAACAPSFFGPALMIGARVVLAGSLRTGRDPRALASSFGLGTITLPCELEALAQALGADLESAGRQG